MIFAEYLKLGVEHILDVNGLDHVLFLIVLVILYEWRSWKSVLILATAFTLGHSLTLALASMKVVTVNSNLVEIFIAGSIAVTALANIISSEIKGRSITRYLAALLFGLIHGLGFSGFFRTILGSEDIFIPLLAFNLGVEIAQLICVILVLAVSYLLCDLLKIKKRYLTTGTSLIIFLYSIKLILERIN